MFQDIRGLVGKEGRMAGEEQGPFCGIEHYELFPASKLPSPGSQGATKLGSHGGRVPRGRASGSGGNKRRRAEELEGRKRYLLDSADSWTREFPEKWSAAYTRRDSFLHARFQQP